MDEMTLLASLRDEVPLAPPSPAAQRLFSAGLAEDNSSERARAMRLRPRYLPGLPGVPGRLRWRLAVTGVVAAGLAAALVAVNLPQHAGPSVGRAAVDPEAGTVVPARLLADLAGQGVLAHQHAVQPDQWIYQKIDSYTEDNGRNRPATNLVQTQWTMADGAETEYLAGGHLVNGLVPGPGSDDILADAARKYAALSSLPNDPAALYAYFAKKVGRVPTTGKPPSTPIIAGAVFGDIESLLAGGVLPPSVTAKLYHALALVPGIVAKKDIKLVTGQSGVGFLLPQGHSHINLEIFLSPTTYQYLGQATWSSGGHDLAEDVLLSQTPVSAPGDLP